jgi:DNA-binding MltR family transcriptional regulator
MDRLNSLFESIHEHDERSMVLTIAAFAEDTLGLLLLVYMRQEKQAKELVNGFNAPLGTFSARIKAAFVLGLMRKDHYEALEILRKIRNEFAHNWEGVSLDREDIRNHVAKLSRSRFEEILIADGEKYDAPDRVRLTQKMSDVLGDLRLLAKNLDKRGGKTPIVMGDYKPVRVEFEVVDRFTDESR